MSRRNGRVVLPARAKGYHAHRRSGLRGWLRPRRVAGDSHGARGRGRCSSSAEHVALLCDNSAGSTCSAEALAQVIQAALLHLAERPGSRIALYVLGAPLPTPGSSGPRASAPRPGSAPRHWKPHAKRSSSGHGWRSSRKPNRTSAGAHSIRHPCLRACSRSRSSSPALTTSSS